MSKMEPKKLLLIDGNNLAHRVFWTSRKLTHGGHPIGLIYGFFRSLAFIKKKFPRRDVVIVWDRSNHLNINHEINTKPTLHYRKELTKTAVEKGLFKTGYKENRDKLREENDDLQDLYEQSELVQEQLEKVKVFQIAIYGCEADDIIYSYALKNCEAGGSTVVISSDKDFMQLLTMDRVTVFDAMKKKEWNAKVFEDEYGYHPDYFLDVCALSGDSSDNIHGVKGVAEKTATKLIIDFGNIESVFEGLEKLEKRKKKEDSVLASKEIVRLGIKLKSMHVVEPLPQIIFKDGYDAAALRQYFIGIGFVSLFKEVGVLQS